MKGIRYLCSKCRKKLSAGNSHIDAENCIGRKYCDYCESNNDDLQIFGLNEYAKLVEGNKHAKL